ncbi:MAG: ACT domain-containing protein [Pyrinomonadaceae bacterium]
MTSPISDLKTLLRSLDPHLHDGVYVYSSVPFDTDLSSVPVIGTFREDEGLTIILAESDAEKAGFPILFRAAWITLTVNSSFEAIGMTAAFSTALGNAGISCNVVAGALHDHVFVPIERAEDAMFVLSELSRR